MTSLYYEDICSIVPDRAVGEDDDDLEDDSAQNTFKFAPVVRWSKVVKERMTRSPNQCLNCHELVIAVGPIASGFVSSYILDESVEVEILGVVCGGMKDSTSNSLGQRSPKDNSCFISCLVSHPDTIFAVCNSEVQVEHSFSWAAQLLSKTCSANTKVHVLTSCSMVEYKSLVASDELPRNFLRSLSSSEFCGSSICLPLEQPNVSTGLPAQLLTYCQVHSIACLLCICYTSALIPEIETFKAFRPLLRSLPFSKLAIARDEDANRRIAQLSAPQSRSTDQLFT